MPWKKTDRPPARPLYPEQQQPAPHLPAPADPAFFSPAATRLTQKIPGLILVKLCLNPRTNRGSPDKLRLRLAPRPADEIDRVGRIFPVGKKASFL
jgi:hypothetical protein